MARIENEKLKIDTFEMIRRSKHPKRKAVIYIADFLDTDRSSAQRIYDQEYIPWERMTKIK